MKLLLMGAGYVGMALLKEMQSLPYEITITTTQPQRVESLREYGKDVLLLTHDRTAILKQQIDQSDGMIVLVAPKNGQSYEETYLNTSKMIAAALEGRQAPFYLLYTSSTSVCEGVTLPWATEDIALSPTSENAKILLETETCYLEANASVCVLRLGGIYGPGRELIDRARRLSGKVLAGTGNEPTNHIHLEDIVSAICFCIEHALTGVYHLVNDDHRTRKELYEPLCQLLGIPSPIWDSERSAGGYRVSNQKIKKAGFSLKHPTCFFNGEIL